MKGTFTSGRFADSVDPPLAPKHACSSGAGATGSPMLPIMPQGNRGDCHKMDLTKGFQFPFGKIKNWVSVYPGVKKEWNPESGA